MAKEGKAGKPVSAGRISRSAGTVIASQTLTARSARVIAIVASWQPLS